MRVIVCLILLAIVVSCSRLGDIERHLQHIQHSLDYQKR